MSNSIAIRIENVTQRFRVVHERPDTLRELFAKFFRSRHDFYDFEAIKNVSFEVGHGEMVGILGRNGSGKSTLLKIIAGVYRPSSGQVEVRGTLAPLIELGAGFHPELTGRENILLNGLLLGFSKQEMLEREQKIIKFAEIGDFIDAPIKQYSSGMFTRLAFSVATEVDPQILLVDEILSVGDSAFQSKCFERIDRFRDAGKTILFVTHSVVQVLQHCNRAILLDKGELILDGLPQEVTRLYDEAYASEVTPVFDGA
jgi:lipopolysaccharide transport system ATP-binding protein